MSDGLPVQDKPASSSGGFMLSGWMVAQLLLAAFLIPAGNAIIELYRGHGFHFPQYRMWMHFSDFTADQAPILWIAQVGLVLNVIGCAARQLILRWSAILVATLFLLVQPGGESYTGNIYLSLAAVAGVWLIWDHSPLGWRMILGTAVGFLLVAAHYGIFARDATAYRNSLLVLHCALVIGGMLLLRALGWRLSLPGVSLELAAANSSARFSFAHLLLCVTCCGLGLMLLRLIDFASADVLETRDLTGIGNKELMSGLFISGFATPALCLVAAWAILSARIARYWLGLLIVAGVLLVGLELFRFQPTLGNPFATPGWRSQIERYAPVIAVANNCLLLVSAPTALLLIYHAAGFRWNRVARSAAGS